MTAYDVLFGADSGLVLVGALYRRNHRARKQTQNEHARKPAKKTQALSPTAAVATLVRLTALLLIVGGRMTHYPPTHTPLPVVSCSCARVLLVLFLPRSSYCSCSSRLFFLVLVLVHVPAHPVHVPAHLVQLFLFLLGLILPLLAVHLRLPSAPCSPSGPWSLSCPCSPSLFLSGSFSCPCSPSRSFLLLFLAFALCSFSSLSFLLLSL